MNKILKYIEPELKVSENIAIIFSGGKLLNQTYGKKIDTYVDIIRFNRAPIKNFETIIGNKTTINVLNGTVFRNIVHAGWNADGQPQYFARELMNIKIITSGKSLAEKRNNYIHESNELFLLNNETEIQKEINTNIQILTMGFAIVLRCILSDIIPHIFGFGSREGLNGLDHYWERCEGRTGSCHEHEIEKNILLKWQQEKKIEIF